ncbi:putative cytosolic oligopeptidase A [Orchesella cincta]|uniref:oligopeptidase A n=1 Tax=Orchesella cincta TaxID=48709 RepID=A0A1D2MMN9_ORCCI|nr:putative cytosolic oligopeptidase A [Orchesella cincta]
MSRVLTKAKISLGRRSRISFRGGYQCRKAATAQQRERRQRLERLPEVPHDTPETNQLLRIGENPNFDKLDKTACRNAVGKLALEVESHVWRIEDYLKDSNFARTYENVIDPIEKLSVPFDYAWSVVKLLNLVKNDFIPTDGFKDLHNRARAARSRKYQSLPIYLACKEIKADASRLQEPQQRVVEKFLLEGKLSGVELTGEDAVQMSNVLAKLYTVKGTYATNVANATYKFRQQLVDPQYIGEMPAPLLRHLAKDKSQPNKAPWLITLKEPVYTIFQEYCPERALRWNAWLAYNSRATGLMDKATSNSVHIEDIRMKRAEQAKLLGFDSYAEMSMKTKMAGSLDTVRTMLATLFSVAKPKQEEEMENLLSFAASRGFDSELKPWDIAFWRRKQRDSLFSTDQFTISEYFPYPQVWQSLLNFSEELFGIKINKKDVPVWNEDVAFYEILDGSSGEKMGGFYIDPYTRPGDKATDGSWLIGNKNRCGVRNVDPLATLVFNFQPPMYGKPALLSFDDVYTLFGKFGQALQHVLTTVTFNEVSGTNNIEWDAVLVPNKFMTMWLGNKTVVKEISSHFDSGESLPDEQVRDLLRKKKHMAAFDLCNQLYLSSVDLELYSSKDFWKDIVAKQWSVYKSPLLLDKKDGHLCSTSEIFSGDFAAAYYSTLWSHMLAADIYQSFVEPNKREIWRLQGLRFRGSFLSMGGGYHPNKVFRQCRGRDPCPDALLWSLGIGPFPKTVSKDDVPTDSEEATSPPASTESVRVS